MTATQAIPARKEVLAIVLALALSTLQGAAEPLRTQSVALQKGWNAVYLEVEPSETAPDQLFADQPIDVVARYFTLVTPVQFITDPADAPWKTKGWGVWYAPQRDDAFLTSLHAIQGNRCYLIHATEASNWSVTGKVRLQRYSWTAGSFNLFGSCLEEQSPPTFGQFFAGAEGKIGSKIYRLVEGKWIKVADPGTARMRAGEACWIDCSGKTDYQGPLDVTVPGITSLDFGNSPGVKEITVRSTFPQFTDVAVEAVATTAGGGALRLNRAVLELSKLETSYPEFLAPVKFPDLAKGEGFRFQVQLSRANLAADGATQASLLKITSSVGAVIWVPVTAGDPTPADEN